MLYYRHTKQSHMAVTETSTAYITSRTGKGRLDEKEISQPFNCLGFCEPEYVTHFVIGVYG